MYCTTDVQFTLWLDLYSIPYFLFFNLPSFSLPKKSGDAKYSTLVSRINRKGEKIVTGYEWFLPDSFTTEVVIALGFIVLGFLTIWIIEYLAGKRVNK